MLGVSLTGTALVASNMGFRLHYTLASATAGVSISGQSTLALPDRPKAGIVTAKDLMDDIGFANILSVSKFLKATDSLQTYSGRKGGGTAFVLTAGEAYFVKMATTVDYRILGSDDPTLSYALDQPAAGVSNSGQTLFAYNYHQTAADAKALMDDIGFANILSVSKFLKATDSYRTYTGRKAGGDAFPLTPGEGYLIKMTTTVNYTPSHY